MPAAKTRNPDAISLLKSDHRKVEGLFARYEKSRSNSAKAKLAQEICRELAIHMAIEEEIFYPATKGTVEDDVRDEAYVEHDGAKVLIAEVLKGSPNDDFYDAKVKVLSEMIKHHVKEEEQPGGMFAQARKGGDIDLAQLGKRMAARKKELLVKMKGGGVPTPATRSMKGVPVERAAPLA